MTKNLIQIAEGLVQIIAGIYKIVRRVYFKFSRNVLKRYFGIETPIYKRWHDRRAKKLQQLLDAEHNTIIYNA